jgi:hypothetical protein
MKMPGILSFMVGLNQLNIIALGKLGVPKWFLSFLTGAGSMKLKGLVRKS